VDESIRPKTPLELAVEKRREKTADSEAAMVEAMAGALLCCGYTRGDDAREVKPNDARYAVGFGLRALIKAEDYGFATEFLTESGGPGTDHAMFDALAEFLILPSSESANRFTEVAATRSRWYGDTWLQLALDQLPSASEIQHGREVDHAIDERKSA
jgi:hypothetical protein